MDISSPEFIDGNKKSTGNTVLYFSLPHGFHGQNVSSSFHSVKPEEIREHLPHFSSF